MSLTKFTENTNVISQLDDTPAISSTELKGKFDESGTKIKDYINNTLTVETEQLVAAEKQSLQTLISNLDTELKEDINNVIETENAMICEKYSTMKTYKVGDLCIYDDTLFKCIEEISISEAWTSSHWEETNLENTINEKIKNELFYKKRRYFHD